MQPAYVSKALVAASANNIALTQTPAGAGNLILNGSTVTAGVAVLDTARQVLLTFAASEVGHNFTIFGTTNSGVAISEVIAGTGIGTVASVKNYKTVTRIAISAAATGAIIAGTNGVGASDWRNLNLGVSPFSVGLAVVITGTVNFTVNYTYEDPDNAVTPGLPVAFAVTALSAKSANTDGGALNTPVAAVQLVVNSGTGTATLIIDQAGIGSP
jgi:hypothetical protein